INSTWGNGQVVPGYGFLLNNRLTSFDLIPGGANQVAPGKHPRSNMTPTLVLQDAQPVFVLGSPGSESIMATVLHVLLEVLDFKTANQPAIDAGRIFSPEYPDLAWEQPIGPETLAALRALGYQPRDNPEPLGAVQAALRGPDGEWVGGADQ